MSNQAKVSSVDALDAFRAGLIIFQNKARRSLDDAGDELRRMRMWLQHDQRMRWENEARKCRKDLERAEAELMSAKLSSLRDNINFQQNAVRKAKAALEHAEDRLRHVRKWSQQFDAVADPLGKRLEGLRQFLDFNLPKGVNYLVTAARTLDDYAESHAAPTTPPSAAPPATPAAAPATAPTPAPEAPPE
jgi:chromosome segregation ATPase